MSDATIRVCAITGRSECPACATGSCDGLRYLPFWMTPARIAATTRGAE